jgi:hypothetical protein
MDTVTPRPSRRWGYLPMFAGAITVATTIGYVRLIRGQGDNPLWWVLAGLAGAAALAIYGSLPQASHRTGALTLAGIDLAAFGVLGIFSIGLPLLVAAGLLVLWGCRSRPIRP